MRRMSEGGIELGFVAWQLKSACDVKMYETVRLGKHQRRKRSLRQVQAWALRGSDGVVGSSAARLVTSTRAAGTAARLNARGSVLHTSGERGAQSGMWRESAVTESYRCSNRKLPAFALSPPEPPSKWAECRLRLRHLTQNARTPERYDLQTDEYEAAPACRAQKWRTAPSENSDIPA
jgi:hypothetical protein